MVVGIHILADLYGVDPQRISRIDDVYGIIEGAVVAGSLTKISSDYHQFEPSGVSGIVLLAESHLSFHTWPEYGLITMDVYTCGIPEHADLAFDHIVNAFNPTTVEYKKLKRGSMAQTDAMVESRELIVIE